MVEKDDIVYYYEDTNEQHIGKGRILKIVEDRYYTVEEFYSGDNIKVPKCMIIIEDAEHKYEIYRLQKQITNLQIELGNHIESMRVVKKYAHEHVGLFGYKYSARD